MFSKVYKMHPYLFHIGATPLLLGCRVLVRKYRNTTYPPAIKGKWHQFIIFLVGGGNGESRSDKFHSQADQVWRKAEGAVD